jgi:hypothetical protein
VRAVLVKPRTADGTADVDSMAPLFMQEIQGDANDIPPQDRFATSRAGREAAGAEAGSPTVRRQRSRVSVGGRCHDLVTYSWWYASGEVGEGVSALEAGAIRVLLGDDGFPLLYEVASAGRSPDDDPRRRVFYVSASLEQAARDTFCDPLPGRQFSIEQSADRMAHVTVAGVVEDGPVPMGPYVYLASGTHEVKAVLCRCSPSRVDAVVATRYYVLDEADSLLEPAATAAASQGDCPEDELTARFESSLRWPPRR